MPQPLALAIVGYVTSAQFVSLIGLEIPFYLVMVGVVLLRLDRKTTEAPVNRPGVSDVIARLQTMNIPAPRVGSM